MDRIWQWAWDRYGPRYSWVLYVFSLPIILPPYLASSFIVVDFEGSHRYGEVAAVTVVAALVIVYAMAFPGAPSSRVIERWAAGGIGINTGVVIAGTIGGGGKLEFTLIGDA